MARRLVIVLSVTATIAAIGLPVLASPAQSHESRAFTLDLDAKNKKQTFTMEGPCDQQFCEARFFAESNQDAALVLGGRLKSEPEFPFELVAGERTQVHGEPRHVEKLRRELRNTGEAKVKVKGIATNDAGSTAVDEIKVRLKD